MSVPRHLIAAFLGAATLLATVPAAAEINGIINGRSANPANLPERSIDVALHERDFAREFGARFNFGINETLTGFANASIVTAGDFGSQGFSIGGGAFLFLPEQRVWDYVDIALKPTLNYYTVEGDGNFDRNILQGSFEALISSKEPIGNTQLSWYANAGLALLINDGFGNDGTDLEPQIGGGAYLPLGEGQLFFGVDIFDGNPDLGVGYRFFL